MTRLFLIACTALLCSATPAAAAERWASPSSADSSGLCLSTSPCTIDHAVNGASPGDQIYVIKGGSDYTATAPLVLPAGALISNVPGEPWPIIHGDASAPAPTLSVLGGGTVEGIALGTTATGQSALHVTNGGVFSHVSVIATGAGAFGMTVEASAATDTVVRDSGIFSRSTDATHAALSITGSGDVALRNVTVWSTEGADGIRCQPTGGETSLVNVLARGAAYDADATGTGAYCTAKHSNFRPGHAPDLVDGGGNQSANPQVYDAVGGNFRLAPDSPLIDAGTEDPLLGEKDLDQQCRRGGGVPDIGAYEGPSAVPGCGPVEPGPEPEPQPEPAADDPAAPAPPPAVEPAGIPEAPQAPVAPPALGRSTVLDVASGTVRVRVPGSNRFVPLTDAANLPIGTVIDASRGTVTVETALPGDATQEGTFGGGRFAVRQEKRGMAVIALRGGSFARCPRVARAASAPIASAAGRRRSSLVRRLWGEDSGGRFRTRGRTSAATVRGTRWLTEDRCNGTYTRVTKGAVDVRNLRTGKVTRLRAGRSLLVRR